jgi:hypothetical protein
VASDVANEEWKIEVGVMTSTSLNKRVAVGSTNL